jgi:heme exporter protein D
VNLADFFAMGGYGFYVWGSYAVTAALIAVETVAVRWRLRSAREAIRASEQR